MDEQEYKPELTFAHKFTLFAGVIMPAISISVEATTHICAETFFDPIPTIWHLLLVIFVPLAQLQVWFAIRRRAPDRLRLAGLLNAIVLGISIFYSFVYLPLVPLAALFLVVGLGLLPLAPYLSLLAAIVMRVHLKRTASQAPQISFAVRKSGLLAGLGFTVLMLGLLELPASLTRYGLSLATSTSSEERSKGIRFLRSFGSRDFLLRSCYAQTRWATDVMGYFTFSQSVDPAEARKIYYQVTGETFDASALPKRLGSRWLSEDSFDRDPNQGGLEVGGKINGLSLTSSKLDASVDGDGGVGYMQWTLVFKNESAFQREARAEVQLPPGAVVSRLTLWVNGEEREAAFAGRGKVRQAYQQIVQQRRDPVLVTTAGRDRVLVQCFPVPPDGGVMKIRFGITVPLMLESYSDARLLLPHFAKSNFRIPHDVSHSVWIASTTVLSSESNSLRLDLPSPWGETRSVENNYILRGDIADSRLSAPETIRLNRSPGITQMWSKDPFEMNGYIVKQSIEERVPNHLKRIVLVVDTSAPMRDRAREIVAAVRSLPSDLDVKLVLTDSTGVPGSSQEVLAADQQEIAKKVQYANYVGGADNAPALNKAWELAAERPGRNAIVWIHSPQLLELQSVAELKQRWERPYGPLLYSVKTAPGSDEIEKQLDGINEVRTIPRTNLLQVDLENLFARLTGKEKTLELVRSSQKMDWRTDLSATYETSDHLARLWANEEVTRILTARDESLNDKATTLAVRYQLVTPVSGAVVLETAQQYRDAGLKPVDEGTVPTIPEPEMIALIAVTIIFLSWLVYRQRRTSGPGGYNA